MIPAAIAWFFVLLLSVPVSAQERVVRLQSGGTVWAVLASQGCDTVQIASLWPLVVADSGLDPRNERSFPVGTPIAIRRDCDGQPFSDSTLRAENEKLKKDIKELTVRLGESETKANIETNRLQGEVARLRTELDRRRFGWPSMATLGFASLFLGFVLGFARVVPFQRKTVVVSPEINLDSIIFSKTEVVEHWGNSVEFLLHYDSDRGTIGYRCPFCGDTLQRNGIRPHLREADHKDIGRIIHIWNGKRVA